MGGTFGAAAGAIVAILALGSVLVAAANEDASPQRAAPGPARARAAGTDPATTTSTLPPRPPASEQAAPEEPPPEPVAEEPPAATPAAAVSDAVASSLAPGPEPEPAPPSPPPSPTPAPGCDGTGGASMHQLHRRVRCDNGVGDIGLDDGMSSHAQFAAERLMNAGACSALFHSPELGAWYGGTYAENVACVDSPSGCVYDATRVMDGWMRSGGHRPHILNPGYRRLGVGVACDGNRSYWVVQFTS